MEFNLHYFSNVTNQKANFSPTISSLIVHSFAAVSGSEACGAIWSLATTASERYAPGWAMGRHQEHEKIGPLGTTRPLTVEPRIEGRSESAESERDESKSAP
jgi:hypothetical protein